MKFPHLIFYTDNMPDTSAGLTKGPIIRIRPAYKNDVGIHRHEYEHVRQWYVTLFTHSILYKFSRKYRMWSEAKAFAKQLENNNIDAMAERMSRPMYDLNITQTQAREEIEKHL